MKQLICIVCPKGCHLQVDEASGYTVTGNACARGDAYGKAELTHPTRVLTSTVCVEGALHRRCPVKSRGVLPKECLFGAVDTLNAVRLTAPIALGQVVVENVCGTGVDLVTSRALEAVDA